MGSFYYSPINITNYNAWQTYQHEVINSEVYSTEAPLIGVKSWFGKDYSFVLWQSEGYLLSLSKIIFKIRAWLGYCQLFCYIGLGIDTSEKGIHGLMKMFDAKAVYPRVKEEPKVVKTIQEEPKKIIEVQKRSREVPPLVLEDIKPDTEEEKQARMQKIDGFLLKLSEKTVSSEKKKT